MQPVPVEVPKLVRQNAQSDLTSSTNVQEILPGGGEIKEQKTRRRAGGGRSKRGGKKGKNSLVQSEGERKEGKEGPCQGEKRKKGEKRNRKESIGQTSSPKSAKKSRSPAQEQEGAGSVECDVEEQESSGEESPREVKEKTLIVSLSVPIPKTEKKFWENEDLKIYLRAEHENLSSKHLICPENIRVRKVNVDKLCLDKACTELPRSNEPLPKFFM